MEENYSETEIGKNENLLDLNKNIYLENTKKTVESQLRTIEKIKNENQKLKDEIALDVKKKYACPTISQQQRVMQLTDSINHFKKKIENNQKKIKELEQLIVKTSADEYRTRKNIGGINASSEAEKMANRKKKTIENQMNKILNNVNEIMRECKIIEEEKEIKIRTRITIEELKKKLEKDINEKEKKIDEMKKTIGIIYEYKDKIEDENDELKKMIEEERELFDEEMERITELIETDENYADMLKNKFSKEINDDINENIDTESDDEYKHIFEKAMEIININGSIDEFINIFQKREDDNFDLFKLCDEIERHNINISNDIMKSKNKIKEEKMSYLQDPKIQQLKKENEIFIISKKQYIKQLEEIDLIIKEINTAIVTTMKRLDLENVCDSKREDYLIRSILLLKDVINYS